MSKKRITNHKSWDVLHCRRDSVIGKAIDDVTNSSDNSTGESITHTAIFLSIFSVSFVIDSQSDGTRLRSYSKWIERYGYEYTTTRAVSNSINNKELMEKVSIYINSRYGFFDLIRHLIKNWTKKISKSGTGLWIGRRRSDKNLTCSEFVMRVFGNLDAYKATPRDAFEWCISKGHKIVK